MLSLAKLKESVFLGNLILFFSMMLIPLGETAVFTFYPSDDSYVDSRKPGENFGSSTFLIAGTETWESSKRIIYLKFDLSDIPSDAMILAAHIELKIGGAPYCGNSETISVYRVDNQTWDEMTITYTNQPTEWNPIPDDTVNVTGSPPYWWLWSVTESLKFVHDAGKEILSIALPGEGPGQCDKPFYSKESSSENHPKLVVITIDEGTINGHVTDLEGEPLRALVIAVNSDTKEKYKAFTNSSGYYEILNLPVGIYWAICIKREYKAGIRKIEVESGKVTECSFKLKPKLE